jgi:hypothetical protein
LHWVSSSRRLTDLALLELERVRRMTAEGPMRAMWLARSEKHLIEGLTAAYQEFEAMKHDSVGDRQMR